MEYVRTYKGQNQVTYPENAYIKAGYQYEKARTPEAAKEIARTIRLMLDAEPIKERQYARDLVETGRREARQTA
jgi:hypothetical protein